MLSRATPPLRGASSTGDLSEPRPRPSTWNPGARGYDLYSPHFMSPAASYQTGLNAVNVDPALMTSPDAPGYSLYSHPDRNFPDPLNFPPTPPHYGAGRAGQAVPDTPFQSYSDPRLQYASQGGALYSSPVVHGNGARSLHHAGASGVDYGSAVNQALFGSPYLSSRSPVVPALCAGNPDGSSPVFQSHYYGSLYPYTGKPRDCNF